ncbi:TPA: hypothetical protein DCW38_05255 [candidate division WOR-3 bacterium]|jgi:membrane associated rhomboid family serine protease|uniref:Peptidase S54 rhomboid domain-containing protein n=1 Tax=candidate division WOR-3 bacterium TaxID=2052148 RepID=A0A350HAK6_UNCW3|nr:hypothetical protein [candidate division WOR-3 bacterium]
MILPIGNTGSIRRLPFISLSLILLNAVIFFAMQPSVIRDNDAVYQSYYEYLNLVAMNMEMRGMDSFDSELLAEEMKNPTISEGDSLYYDILSAKESFEEANKNHPFSRYGVSKNNLSIKTLFTSMFVHADIIHLVGNLWFLFLLGFNIEDIYGRMNYLIFYILSGIISSFIFIASVTEDPQLSLIGASGAIAGVMGAFLVKLYKTKIKFFYWLFPIKPLYGTFFIYAGLSLPIWFLQQIFESASNSTSNVAFMAHIGGFLFGAIVAMILSATKIEERFISPKVNEASNLLKMNKEEEDGVEAYLDNDFERAKKLLLSNFEKRRTYSAFVPLFVSLKKLNDNAIAQRVMNIYIEELNKSKDSSKINEIYEDIKNAGIFDSVNSTAKLVFAKRLKDSGNIDAAREIFKSVAEREKYTILGYKTMMTAFDENIIFEGIDDMASDYINHEGENLDDIKQNLIRRKNEQK